MHGGARDGRTLAREAYFFEFAKDIQAFARMPVMVTGGVRRLPVAEQVVSSGVDMVGIATALAIDPNLPRDWENGRNSAPELSPITWKNKPLASLAYMSVVKYQLLKHSLGKPAKPEVSPLWALACGQLNNTVRSRRYRRKMAA